MYPIRRMLAKHVAFASISAALLLAAMASPFAAAPSAVSTLLGTWAGNGRITYTDGSSEGIHCNAYYTGGENELRMAIRCQSDKNPINIRSQLRIDGSKASGAWEERTFNASGTASGTARTGSLSLNVSGGGFSGMMTVSFSKSSHTVSITTQGIAMSRATMSFSRR